ncbi:helix-turn-helix transcriptional regulator [Streptomyces sp. NPDC050804]|uniref:helix-turn-helix domain-containing protein n=1 Tax=Streptomyces sp. NPDC050804 TaxID=3154745 RepID=UPI00343B1244
MATTEAEAFAELLRKLKDRSGQSYGVLAGKLHVSTSTLHRYCNGDAVPAEYASVERLARLCGARAEEVVELHRRWILADEARRRGRSAATAVPAVDPAPAAAAAAATPAAPAAAAAAAADPAPAPAAAPAAEAEVVESELTGDTSVIDRPGGSRTGPRVKRLWLVLAAAAVVAVVVPAVILGSRAGLASGDDSVTAGATDDPGKPAGAGSGPHSASPEAKSPSASLSPTASVSRSGGTSPSSSPGSGRTPVAGPGSGSGSDRDAAGGAVPVTVSTRPYAFEDPCSQHYLIDRPPTEVPPPPTEQDAPGWVNALGGVASEGQYIELTVQGTGSETVVLQALHVRVVKSGAPLAWTDYVMGVGCGGGVSTKSFDVDLDAGRPSSVPRAGQRDFPYKVSESDPEVLYISARSSARDVSWYLELEWSSGERHGMLRVDDRGRPFRTSGATGRPAYEYPPGGTEWLTAATG